MGSFLREGGPRSRQTKLKNPRIISPARFSGLKDGRVHMRIPLTNRNVAYECTGKQKNGDSRFSEVCYETPKEKDLLMGNGDDRKLNKVLVKVKTVPKSRKRYATKGVWCHLTIDKWTPCLHSFAIFNLAPKWSHDKFQPGRRADFLRINARKKN